MSAIDTKTETSSWKTENPNKARDAISWHAYTSGVKAGAVAAVVAAVAVLSANKYSSSFRSRLS
ncbi:Hypothetical protein PHPALM_38133, partial [Phytophthora palmivora]